MSESPYPKYDAYTRRQTQKAAVELVVPVYNEAHVLSESIQTLHEYMVSSLGLPFKITVADNASTDSTFKKALLLAEKFPEVKALHLDQKGRGLALRAAWSQSDADVVAYTDVDLSTDLTALPALLHPLLADEADLAFGSRLSRESEVTRGPKRELISRGYNLILRASLRASFSDAQCGFKAGRREVIQSLLPEV